jgi:hypothetical protein
MSSPGDSYFSSAAPWSSTTGLAFFTDRLCPLSTSARGSNGTCTFDFDDARALACHDGACDSPDESSPDGHRCPGWLSNASGTLILAAMTTSMAPSPIPTSFSATLADPN